VQPLLFIYLHSIQNYFIAGFRCKQNTQINTSRKVATWKKDTKASTLFPHFRTYFSLLHLKVGQPQINVTRSLQIERSRFGLTHYKSTTESAPLSSRKQNNNKLHPINCASLLTSREEKKKRSILKKSP
jgi:hypothetical protein